MDFYSDSFVPPDFQRQSVNVYPTGPKKHVDNLFHVSKLPTDCGILVLHSFMNPYSWTSFSSVKSLDTLSKNYLSFVDHQLKTYLVHRDLWWSETTNEGAGMVLASLTHTQANGFTGHPYVYPGLEPSLISAGFNPLFTTLNGNSGNDVRLYGLELTPKNSERWFTPEEKYFV